MYQLAVTDPTPWALVRLFMTDIPFVKAASGHPAKLLHAAVPVQTQTARPLQENFDRAGVSESDFCNNKIFIKY